MHIAEDSLRRCHALPSGIDGVAVQTILNLSQDHSLVPTSGLQRSLGGRLENSHGNKVVLFHGKVCNLLMQNISSRIFLYFP